MHIGVGEGQTTRPYEVIRCAACASAMATLRRKWRRQMTAFVEKDMPEE